MFVYSRSSDHIPSTVEDIMVEMLQYACPEFATIAECTAPLILNVLLTDVVNPKIDRLRTYTLW